MSRRSVDRAAVTISALVVLAGVTACSTAEGSKVAEAPSASSSASGSPTSSPTTPGTSRPERTATDFNGPPNVGVRFTVPEELIEVADGMGKRAYKLAEGNGSILIGELKHVYATSSDGLLQPRRVGNDAAAALEVIRQREDYEILAQGTVPAAGKEVPLVAVRLAKGAFASDLWCFTHDSSCYKNPQGLMTQTILIPWGDSMIWMNVEWDGNGRIPPALLRARDQLLRSLRIEG